MRENDHVVVGFSENGKPLVSDGSILEGWSKPSNPENNHTEFDLQFDVPQKFGIPVAILVKNQHPNEFCLVSFSLNIPNNATALDFWANSWVANTGTKEGRVFFLNKVWIDEHFDNPLRNSLP